MRRYIFKRLLQLIPVLIGITFLSFAMMRLAGGDAVTYMYENAGSAVSQEIIDKTKAEYGLDKPFPVQYANWFAGMVTGDMGESYVSHRDVYETFTSKLPATIMLTLSSIILTVLLAVPLGILSAVKHNKWIDYVIRFLSFVGNSMPNFFAAMVLMYFLSVKLGILPVVTNSDLGQSIILPTLTLAVSMAAKYTRQVRATVLEELNKPYVMGAGSGNQRKCDHMEKCYESINADDHHSSGLIHRKSSGRNSHCREYFYVGRSWKAGCRCHQYARLSHYTGLCGMDGGYLCTGKSCDRYRLPLS